MIRPGLVSITFRKLSPAEVAALASRSGLAGVEWGGDIHAPHGDLARAAEVRRLTLDAGLEVAAYGSYYRLAESETAGLSFTAVLDSADALGAEVIRVWAGARASAEADAGYRQRVSEDARRTTDLAAARGKRIACEYHGHSLTDTLASAEALLADLPHPAFRTYWQPRLGDPVETNEAELRRLLPRLEHLHVFHWDASGRLPLAAGETPWRRYFTAAAEAPGDRWALLEFVRDDDPAQLPEEAASLRRLLADCANRI